MLRLSGGVADDDDDFSGPDEPAPKVGLTTVEQTLQMLEEGGSDWSSMDKDKVCYRSVFVLCLSLHLRARTFAAPCSVSVCLASPIW